MQICFMITTDDSRTLQKNTSPIKNVSGTFKDNCSVENPIVLIKKDDINVASVNYAYISDTERFYYITDFVFTKGGILEVHLKVDVLNTYASAIKSIYTLIERQENVSNKYIHDEQLLTRTERIIEKKKVGSVANASGFFLTVNGGV